MVFQSRVRCPKTTGQVYYYRQKVNLTPIFRDDFNDGLWVGWRGNDLDATIDLQPAAPIHTIQMRFL
jgi:hypothetical protein